jgi:hypothetical protein
MCKINSLIEDKNTLKDFNIESSHDRSTSTSENQDRIVVVDAEVHTDDKLSQKCINMKQKSYLVRKLERTAPQSFPVRLLPCSDEICKVESNPKHCESFKLFSRRYLLHKTLEMLNSEPDETKYYTYKNHLINVEKCFEHSNLESASNDLDVAVTNAWHLSQNDADNGSKKSSNKRNLSTGALKFPVENKEDIVCLERSKLISAMLSLAAKDDEYCHCLTKLSNM